MKKKIVVIVFTAKSSSVGKERSTGVKRSPAWSTREQGSLTATRGQPVAVDCVAPEKERLAASADRTRVFLPGFFSFCYYAGTYNARWKSHNHSVSVFISRGVLDFFVFFVQFGRKASKEGVGLFAG